MVLHRSVDWCHLAFLNMTESQLPAQAQSVAFRSAVQSPLLTMASGKKPARSEYFVIDRERYSRIIMDLFKTAPGEPVSLALVKQVWEDRKQWGRGLNAVVSTKRKPLIMP